MNTTLPNTIKALKTQPGNTIAVVDLPFGTRDDVKHLAPDSVVVKVRACGCNPTDYKHAFDEWRPADPNAEFVCGCDGAGDVVAVGSAVKHVKVGSRVAGFCFGTSNPFNGSYAEYVIYNKAVTFELPSGMSYAEGAAMPIPHLTAVQALYIRLLLSPPSAPSKENKSILSWGGSTAVGHHAIQLAKASGYKVFVTASPGRFDFLKSIGADECFDYRSKDVVEEIKKASGGGVDFAVDSACSHGSTESCIDSIKASGGQVITTLPVTDEQASRRENVSVEFTLVYSELGYALTFANAIDMPAMPEDARLAENWVTKELPALLEGWKDGKSSKLIGAKLRENSGGLEGIIEGLKIMQKGEYAAEKLVYDI